MIGSHIIPKFYLERFSEPSERGRKKTGKTGLVWVYERDKQARRRGTSVQGVENGYFGYVKKDGALEESFETELAILESACNEVLVCARSNLYHWPPGSQSRLAFYAALLFSRAKQRRISSQKIYKAQIEQLRIAMQDEALVNDLAKGLSRTLGKPAPPGTIRQGIIAWLSRADNADSAKNTYLADLLRSTNLVAQHLVKKQPWQLLRPPRGAEFVTSDNPLVTVLPVGNKLLPGHGFGKREVVAGFPLAPDACLVMGNAWQPRRTVDASTLGEVNEAIIRICDRYIYSKTYSAGIQNIVAQFAGIVRYGINAFVPPDREPQLKKILRKKFGVGPE